MGVITSLTGYFLLVFSCLSYSVLLTWIIFSKFLWSPEENQILKFFQEDYYYCLLIVMMIPTTTMLIYGNWVSMKFFRHN